VALRAHAVPDGARVNDRVSAELTRDELKLIQLLRTSEPDADLEVHKRDGAVVNVVRSTIHRKEFERARLLETLPKAT